MLTQTLAILLDAYRELNAKKLFWVTMGISGLVVIAFAAVGINDQGVTVFGYLFPAPINSSVVPPDTFYKFIFTTIGARFWLTWGAAILALVSTAGMIPDFLSAGGVDVVLSKPIGRARLFLTKYAGALMFAALQAAAFSLAVFLVIGIRGKSWEPVVFLTIPLVTAFFSFLYCISALVGLLTRSTIAALMSAIGFWLLIFAAHTTETIYLQVKVGAEQRVVALEARAVDVRKSIEDLKAEPAPAASTRPEAPAPSGSGRGLLGALADAARTEFLADSSASLPKAERLSIELSRVEASLERDRARLRSYTTGHSIAFAAKTILPKTAETMELLKRSMLSMSDIQQFQDPDSYDNYAPPPDPNDPDGHAARVSDMRAAAETVQSILRARSVWWVLGTSLLFEAAIVGLAVRIFSRRDF